MTVVLDVDELRAELTLAQNEGLELADEITEAILNGGARSPRVAALATDFRKKRIEIKRLRRAVAVEVAG